MENRKYRYHDAHLIALGGVIEEHFKKHAAALSSFDGSLTLDWYQPILKAAKATSLDDFVQGGVTGSTMQREAQIAHCRGYYKRLRYFVDLAFAERRPIMEQFDVDRYRDVRNSSVKFLRFMQHFLRQAELHADTLIALGMQETLLSQAQEQVALLDSYISERVALQSQRRGRTAERIAALNTLYKAMRRIEKVAGFVFEEDPAPKKSFRLPRQPRSKPKAQPQEQPAPAVSTPEAETETTLVQAAAQSAAPVQPTAPASTATPSPTPAAGTVQEPPTDPDKPQAGPSTDPPQRE